MTVWLLWYGYEDVEGVFMWKHSAEAHIEELIRKEPYRRRENFSIVEEEVLDV